MELNITLHPHQSKAFNSTRRFVAIISGVQGGKTFCGAVWMTKQSQQFKDVDHLICAPTYKILNSSTLPKFFEVAPFYRKYHHKQESYIQIPGGKGRILIRSTEDPYGMEGMTLKDAWMDEAGQMKSLAWIVIQARLAIHQGKAFMTTTPYNLGWLYQDIYNKFKEGDPNYDVIQFTSQENPYFPEEEYQRAMESMDPRVFAMRYQGKFEKMQGLVYQDFTTHNIVERDKIPPTFKEVIAGIDWGYNNPAAIVVLGIDNDNTVYVLDEYYQSGKLTSEIVEQAKHFQNKYNIRIFYGDSAEPDRIEEAKRAGLNIRPAQKDVKLGIDTVRNLIVRNQLKVVHECINTIDEFETYHYEEPKGDKNEREDPVKEKDHIMDALRYAVYTHRPENRVTLQIHDPYINQYNTAFKSQYD